MFSIESPPLGVLSFFSLSLAGSSRKMVSAAPKKTERTIGMGVVQKGSLAYEHHSYEVIFHFLLVLTQFKFLRNHDSDSSTIFWHFAGIGTGIGAKRSLKGIVFPIHDSSFQR